MTDPGLGRILSVSPIEQDHTYLQEIFANPRWNPYTTSKLVVLSVYTLKAALKAFRDHYIPVVLCERDLVTAAWTDLLESVRLQADSPHLIVTARLADEYLWAEALNLGAWDVLAKPFDREEVVRVVGSAWRHWMHRHEIPARPAAALRAAS